MNDYHRIARVIRYLDEHHIDQPSLVELADLVGLSPYHFHRLFTRWAGVTPKEFLQCLTLGHVKDVLRSGSTVLDAAFDAGLSGPGRLHDLCIKLESATPGEIKTGGDGWAVQASCGESPFGTCVVGTCARGICHLSFVEDCTSQDALRAIQSDWPRADITWVGGTSDELLRALFGRTTCATSPTLKAIVGGTKFQIRVWKALLEIPRGSLSTYSRIAETLGDRSAARAVGTAVGQNRIAFLIPCHRVIRETGIVGEYRWGSVRKKAIVAWENSTSKR